MDRTQVSVTVLRKPLRCCISDTSLVVADARENGGVFVRACAAVAVRQHAANVPKVSVWVAPK